jgi:hypothetical protein
VLWLRGKVRDRRNKKSRSWGVGIGCERVR